MDAVWGDGRSFVVDCEEASESVSEALDLLGKARLHVGRAGNAEEVEEAWLNMAEADGYLESLAEILRSLQDNTESISERAAELLIPGAA